MEPDFRLARAAGRQHGVLSTSELLAFGLTRAGISRPAATGALHPKHRGVYAVGHPAPSRDGIWLAAVKACGPEAALSHHSAGQHSRMLPLAANPRPVHVTVPGTGGRRRRNGIIVHRSKTIRPADVALRDGIPTTKPARALADLKPLLAKEQWEAALDRARFLGLPIGDLGVDDPARSSLERAFLGLCRRHRLPEPEVNVFLGLHQVDFLWRT